MAACLLLAAAAAPLAGADPDEKAERDRGARDAQARPDRSEADRCKRQDHAVRTSPREGERRSWRTEPSCYPGGAWEQAVGEAGTPPEDDRPSGDERETGASPPEPAQPSSDGADGPSGPQGAGEDADRPGGGEDQQRDGRSGAGGSAGGQGQAARGLQAYPGTTADIPELVPLDQLRPQRGRSPRSVGRQLSGGGRGSDGNSTGGSGSGGTGGGATGGRGSDARPGGRASPGGERTIGGGPARSETGERRGREGSRQEGGRLPFSGLDGRSAALLGLALIVAGVGLRRAFDPHGTAAV